MVFNVVDVSSHQSVEAAAFEGAEGCIVKATQGTGYINPSCDAQYQYAKARGLKLGVYHYAGGGDPVAEADYFLRHIAGYIHEAILVLDWEEYQNAQYNNTNWARQFVDRVHAKTGVWCIIYGNRQDINRCQNLVNDCGLWFAGFPDLRSSWDAPNFPYNISPWKSMVMWQFTTSNGTLDRNKCYITKEQWDMYANPAGGAKPTPTTTKKPEASGPYSTANKSLETMAGDVSNGLVGSGDERRKILGGYWRGVQAIVDERFKAITAAQCHAILADETWNGRYGNGEDRKFLLGNYYDAVQTLINNR